MVNKLRGEHDEPIGWTDVFPEWQEEGEPVVQTEEQMLQVMLAWANRTAVN